MRSYLLLCVLTLVVACKGGSETPAPPPTPAPAEPSEPEIAEPTAAPESEGAPATARSEVKTEPEPADLPVERLPSEQPTEPVRDLAAELREAVGSPADCLRDYRPSTAKTISVRISALVRPTGLVVEPRASGAGLSKNDQRCVEERVGGAILRPLEGSASQPVSTYIEIEYTPPAVQSYDVAPPPPPSPNVVPSLPKKEPIAPSGEPIEGPAAKPIEGPAPKPIEGPSGEPIEGPAPVPIGSK
jgi:hypothetical protein